MKNLSVVFLVYKDLHSGGNAENFILLGKQAPGKKMPGIRNGFGGKCEFLVNENREETTLECAKRELKEESGINTELTNFIKIGNLVNGDKCVDFFVVNTENKLMLSDNSEFVDITWFDLGKPELFLSDMLSGDHMIMQEVFKYVKNPETFKEFKINKTGDKILEMQTKNIFS